LKFEVTGGDVELVASKVGPLADVFGGEARLRPADAPVLKSTLDAQDKADRSVVVTGIYRAIDEAALLASLQARDEAVKAVEWLSPADRQFGLAKVLMSSTAMAKKAIADGVRVGYQVCKARPYRLDRTPQQCFKCWKFDHVADACKAASNTCKTCSSNQHKSAECPVKDLKNGDLKCPLCGGAHSARWQGCPKMKEARRKLNEPVPAPRADGPPLRPSMPPAVNPWSVQRPAAPSQVTSSLDDEIVRTLFTQLAPKLDFMTLTDQEVDIKVQTVVTQLGESADVGLIAAFAKKLKSAAAMARTFARPPVPATSTRNEIPSKEISRSATKRTRLVHPTSSKEDVEQTGKKPNNASNASPTSSQNRTSRMGFDHKSSFVDQRSRRDSINLDVSA
jgi:predicted Zn-ribbon and HTH transcriptional regulator